MTSILPPRYTDLGPIGFGGMAEVRRVRDGLLRSVVAMKICQSDDPLIRRRFSDEARLTAQLHHPGIVAVHDLGELSDGRAYFTMEEVRGSTLAGLVQTHHSGPTWDAAVNSPPVAGPPRPLRSDGVTTTYTLRELIGIVRRSAEAVAYAHGRGVVHRDLKPENIMVGDFGEVRVMDWGLALWRERAEPPSRATQVHELDLGPHGTMTRTGQVMGTPAYMSPEQARGDTAAVGVATDIYALGAMVYTVLAGRAPYSGGGSEAWRAVLAGPPAQLDTTRSPAVLCEVAERAMARTPEDRYTSAAALAAALDAWLDGERRREEALLFVARADAMRPQVAQLRADAEAARLAAIEALAGVQPYDSVERKHPAWVLEDASTASSAAARRLEVEMIQELRGSLNIEPELVEAHDRLADLYRAGLLAAEARRDAGAADEMEVLLRAHDRGRYTAWLQGDGAITLHSEPPGATVELYRWVEERRRRVPQHVRTLGVTPIDAAPVQRGSYLLTLSRPGEAPVRYPVLIERGEHWDGVAPGGAAPTPVGLAPVGARECRVPGGWTWTGGDQDAADGLPLQRWWIDPFVVGRDPITNAEYLTFLNDLVARGEAALAERYAPAGPDVGLTHYVRAPDGRFRFGVDTFGRIWRDDHPVVLVSWWGASAYAAWRAERDGLPWRLPHDLEWEKAARGVDRRLQPWGDFLEPTWVNVAGSRAGAPAWSGVDEHPLDESPYGVRGLAGNVRDWCANGYRRGGPPGAGRLDVRPEPDGPFRMARGGAWTSAPRTSRPTARYADAPDARLTVLGFRLVR